MPSKGKKTSTYKSKQPEVNFVVGKELGDIRLDLEALFLLANFLKYEKNLRLHPLEKNLKYKDFDAELYGNGFRIFLDSTTKDEARKELAAKVEGFNEFYKANRKQIENNSGGNSKLRT